MEKVRDFFTKRPALTLTITSIGSILTVFFTNWLYELLSKINSIKLQSGEELVSPSEFHIIIVTVLVIIAIIIIYLWSKLLLFCKDKLLPDNMDAKCSKSIFFNLRDLEIEKQDSVQNTLSQGNHNDMDKLISDQVLKNMQIIVDHCYSFFEETYTNREQIANKIKFEATFMTLSYIDDKITIPCSANVDKIQPASMQLRINNPDIYKNTVTAKIYETEHPNMVLIEDTSKEVYTALYAKQKKRIKSTVVLPVLSNKNVLLGTLVVHCNKANFFTKDKYGFWNELLDVYAVELGYYKALLDYIIENNNALTKPF